MPYQHFYLEESSGSGSFLKNNPVLLYSGFVYEEPNWYYQEHSHPFCEIVYIYDGAGEFCIGGKLYIGQKGDILVYNAGVPHEERSDPSNPLKTYFCGIENVMIQGLKENQIIPDTTAPLIHAGDTSSKLESYISDLVLESSSKLKGYETLCSNLLSSIIILVSRITNAADKPAPESVSPMLIKNTKNYIDRYYSSDLNLSTLAKNFYISKDYLSHVFKNETGFSPIKYLMIRRVEEAKKLLTASDFTVNEISSAVGYDDPNYFSVIFKKLTGFSPLQYRNTQK